MRWLTAPGSFSRRTADRQVTWCLPDPVAEIHLTKAQVSGSFVLLGSLYYVPRLAATVAATFLAGRVQRDDGRGSRMNALVLSLPAWLECRGESGHHCNQQRPRGSHGLHLDGRSKRALVTVIYSRAALYLNYADFFRKSGADVRTRPNSRGSICSSLSLRCPAWRTM